MNTNRVLYVISITIAGLGATTPLEDRAWGILIRGVAEENAIRRAQAVAALGAIGNLPKAAGLTEPALADKEWTVRQAAVAALGEMKSRASIPKLQQALDDDTPEVSFTAAKALWEMGDRTGRDVFLEILAGERRDSPGFVRGSVRDAKSKLHNRAGLAWMGLKQGAGFALGPFAMGIGVMEEMLKDSSASARALSVTILASDNDPESLPQIEGALADKNWIVRTAAAKALGTRSSRGSIPKLEGLLDDEKDAVRYMAAATIVKLANTRSVTRKPAKRS